MGPIPAPRNERDTAVKMRFHRRKSLPWLVLVPLLSLACQGLSPTPAPTLTPTLPEAPTDTPAPTLTPTLSSGSRVHSPAHSHRAAHATAHSPPPPPPPQPPPRRLSPFPQLLLSRRPPFSRCLPTLPPTLLHPPTAAPIEPVSEVGTGNGTGLGVPSKRHQLGRD